MRNNVFNVVIDTNVIIASLLTSKLDSATVRVMDLFYNNKINLFYSDEILAEYIEVINRTKFSFDKALIDIVIRYIVENGINISPKNCDKILIDVKDKPFYELVMDEHIDNAKLITGNIKHFPIQTNIITPKDFIEMYNQMNNG